MRIKTLLLALLTSASGSAYSVEIYKWTDARGQVHYSNSPAMLNKHHNTIKLKLPGTRTNEDKNLNSVTQQEKSLFGPPESVTLSASGAPMEETEVVTYCLRKPQ